MAKKVRRGSCLYNGESYGIEMFYTLIDGKQINVDNGLLEQFRELGKRDELFCDCEAKCGSNVTIVAGEAMLKRQHFRIRGKEKVGCTAKDENAATIHSRIILKCWLQEKLKIENEDFFCEKNINEIFGAKRKFELTYYVKKYNIGLIYSRLCSSFVDEKLDCIDMMDMTNCIYACDIENLNNNEQYPEFMIKVQKKQGFCLFLEIKYEEDNKGIKKASYQKSKFHITYCLKKPDGAWNKLDIINDYIAAFDVYHNGQLVYNTQNIMDIIEDRLKQYRRDEKLQETRAVKCHIQEYETKFDKFSHVKIRCPYCGAYNVELQPAYYDVRIVCKHFKCQKESYIKQCPKCKSNRIKQKKFSQTYSGRRGVLECNQCGFYRYF